MQDLHKITPSECPALAKRAAASSLYVSSGPCLPAYATAVDRGDALLWRSHWHRRAEEERSSEASHAEGVLVIFLKTKIIFLSETEQEEVKSRVPRK